MAQKYLFQREEDSIEVTLLRGQYQTNGNTAVAMAYENQEGEPCELVITVNLRDYLAPQYAYIDENNASGATKFLTDIGAGQKIGIRGYNYCVYPLFKFNQEFLDSLEAWE